MKERDKATVTLQDLETNERSIVMSFLALSERTTTGSASPCDELATSLALKSALKERAN